MKEPATFTVDGETYTVQPFITSHGLQLLTELFALVGASAVRIAFNVMGSKAKAETETPADGAAEVAPPASSEGGPDISAAEAAAAMANLTSRLKPETVDALFKRVLKGTLIGTTSISAASRYDVHFQGRYGHLFQVVWKSLEVQYGDFLGALGGLSGLVRRKDQT